MKVIFYSFSKRTNSTAVPTGGTEIDFVYKDGSDLHNPVLVLSTFNDTWNYASIGSLYFYINSVKRVSYNHVEITLRIDTMATYRNYIIGTWAYIAYGTNGANKDIADPRFPISGLKTMTQHFVDIPILSNQHSLVITVAGANGIPNPYGAFTKTYYITPENANAVAQLLFYLDENDALNKLARYFKSPYDSVISMKLVAANLGAALGTPEDIWLGQYNTGTEGFPLNERIIEGDVTIPLNWPFGDWRDMPPYNQMYINFPVMGIIDIDIMQCYQAESLTLHYCLDAWTGDIAFKLSLPSSYNNAVLATFQTTVGVDIPIGQTVTGSASALTSLIGMVGSSFAGNGPSALSTGYRAATEALTTHATTRGQVGGVAGTYVNNRIEVVMISHPPYNYEPSATLGRPVGTVAQIQSGYVQTVAASVSAPAYAGELAEINGILNGGAYIE